MTCTVYHLDQSDIPWFVTVNVYCNKSTSTLIVALQAKLGCLFLICPGIPILPSFACCTLIGLKYDTNNIYNFASFYYIQLLYQQFKASSQIKTRWSHSSMKNSVKKNLQLCIVALINFLLKLWESPRNLLKGR